jgi:hypothetical protein
MTAATSALTDDRASIVAAGAAFHASFTISVTST